MPISGWNENLFLVSARPLKDGKHLFIHVREINGRSVIPELINSTTGKPVTIMAADPSDRVTGETEIKLRPPESRFFLLETGL